VLPRLRRRAIRQAEIAGFALGPGIEGDRSRSDFEMAFLELCRRYAFSAPEVNVRIGRWTVDFVWPASRIAVETDSYRYHRAASPSRTITLAISTSAGAASRSGGSPNTRSSRNRIASRRTSPRRSRGGPPPPHRVRRSPPPRHSSS
jgi:hypothetical protein